MAEFTVLVLKIAFLIILWLFVIIMTAVINTDMVGKRQKGAGRSSQAGTPKKKAKKEPWILAIDSGKHAGDRLQLVPEVRIGRSDSCELVLDDDYVSSMHAELTHQGEGKWLLKDLGSTNGTYLNAERINEPVIVSIEDIIRVGEVQMRLEL